MMRPFLAAAAALAVAAVAPAALAQSAPADKRASSEPARQTPVQSGKKAGVAKQDRQFFRDMAQANRAEVQAGKLAQQQASSPQVKEFAQHMVKDHSRMLEEQRAMAKAKGMQMPRQVKKEHQDALQKLQAVQGERFDRAYMAQMVQDHERTLKLVQQAAKQANDPQLRAMADKAAPEIEKHLELARQLSERAAAGGTQGSGKYK